MFRFLPEQASEFAPSVDWINNLITDISVFFTVAIVGSMIYFAIKYKKRNNVDHETPAIEGSHALELVWTIVPTVICIFVAAYGYIIYDDLRHVPENAMTINVQGQKWKWDFQYSNGKKTTNEFVVPVDEPVRLVMTSTDVLHSFFVPAMRVKNDVIPKQYTYLWFKPVKTGVYRTFCTEYCGTNHSAMLATLRVVSRAEFDRWLEDDSDALRQARLKPSDLGKELYVSKTCNICHSLTGTPGIGPSFLKIFGQEEEMADGSKVKVDENYLRTSIVNPNAQIVKGYAPAMPSFAGQLSEDEILGLIEFIKTVDGSAPIEVPAAEPPPAADPAELAKMTPAERGRKYYNERLCITCHSLDGSKLVGPSFKGLYGRSGKLADGSSYTADDEYIKHSILKPADQVVEGYAPTMPPYEGQLNDENIADITEFLKTVK